ncbi:metal-dependent transcriptional regulator [Roseivirga sp. BDSF3-8]|uniref:metal-dependent transcriptional regulator n=1 Tax=Roseivirga sp. BDSF3-8 TaxID=3241598 RepID=UPI0035320F35
MPSLAEENYLKAIYHLSTEGEGKVTTNAISDRLNTKPASVSDMLRKLSAKELVSYRKYQGVSLTVAGRKVALLVIRKHRLWEVFLVEKLKFNWDEVHEVAEQLEHIQSPLLIHQLDEFLGYPKYDPHGDPIPDENGEFSEKEQSPLSDLEVGETGKIVAVKDSSAAFLQYLDKVGAYLGARVKVKDRVEFDGSMEIELDGKKQIFVSREVSANLLITE